MVQVKLLFSKQPQPEILLVLDTLTLNGAGDVYGVAGAGESDEEDKDDNDVEDFDAMLEKQFGYVDDEGNIVYIGYALEEEERKEDVGADSHDLPQALRDTKPDVEEEEEKAETLENDVSDLSANEIKAEMEPPAAPAPCPCINPALMIRGIYGGDLEDGDREITLDDCWSLVLKHLDEWKQVLPGTMSHQIWKSKMSETEESSNGDEDDEDCDEDFEDEDEDEQEKEEGNDRTHLAPLQMK
ncbi:hypothetical protein PsorP6_017868 [Peronosclerospora sorghi]|uniref:Uncharacterized protein n=1 Tax=Peronosclerospora sorghi TaxID=230839 RepID=A0ACC0WDS5_9STRA|nr:hypothetical protein PsorP6_017868 [Peronosclerospora sorghi]